MADFADTPNGLLTLELPHEALNTICEDIFAEVNDWRWTYIRAAGVEARVMGFLVERRLAGEVEPNLMAAVFLTGSGPAVREAIRADDKMYLGKNDYDALETRVAAAQSELGRRRGQKRAILRKVAKAALVTALVGAVSWQDVITGVIAQAS